MAAGGRGSADDPVAVLGEGPVPAVVLLCGPESFLVERAIETIRRRLGVIEEPDRGRTVWGDDPAERIAEALDDLASPGLFGGIRLVVVRRAEALKGASEARVSTGVEQTAGGHLVLAANAMDRRRKLFQSVPRDGVHEYPALGDRHALAGWVGRLAREYGVRVSSDGASELIERCGGDLARLASELQKLAFVGASVGIEEVRRSVATTRSHGVEELATALETGDRAAAIRRLRALLAEGEAPLRIVAFLAANLRRSLHVAELAEAGLGEGAIAARLKIPGWLVRKQMGRASASWLVAALASLAALDRALKQSRAPDAAVEAAIAGLTTPRSAGRRPG
jgi:DNA polymerase-3 subunit delta